MLGKQRFHGASGHLGVRAWREQVSAIFSALEKAVRETVQGDDRHSAEIQSRCRDAVAKLKEADSTDAVSVAAIEYFAHVTFMLVGQFPSNWEKAPAAAGHPRAWKLTQYRTLRYDRTPEQMYEQILALTGEPRSAGGMPAKRELQRTFAETCKRDYRAFLRWFKTAHPDHYLTLV